MAGVAERLDAFQQRHVWAAFGFAVVQKFGEDQAGNLAALIAYYAFFSVFPLLLALVTILGYVLAGAPALQQVVFHSALGQFPIIGQYSTIRPLTGNPAGLVIGLLLASWSGLAVATTAQTAFNTVYAVPRTDWPGFLPRLGRAAELVAVGGLGLIATTLLQGVVSGGDTYGLRIGVAGEVMAGLLGVVANTVLFVYLFRRLTVAATTSRQVLAGAVTAALAWFVLQKVGTSLVNGKIHGATGAYGTFAVVIGLLFWFFVLAQITLVCAEINVVAAYRLWPRGLQAVLNARATTGADLRAYTRYPQRERQAHNVTVTARLEPDRPGPSTSDTPGTDRDHPKRR